VIIGKEELLLGKKGFPKGLIRFIKGIGLLAGPYSYWVNHFQGIGQRPYSKGGGNLEGIFTSKGRPGGYFQKTFQERKKGLNGV